MSDPVVILGLGFTTQRLARRLRLRDTPVYATVRATARFAELGALGVRLCAMVPDELPKGAVLVHSVPPLDEPERSRIRALIGAIAPRRILYISSTGVYGSQARVTERTPVAPADDKGQARVDEEQWIAEAWSSLILRSAAIYGPGRGIHVKLREGKRPRGAGGLISRIQVDDLAALLEAGINSSLQGAWPVADDLPASSDEVVAWCANLMGLPLPDCSAPGYPVAGRDVDGRKIRELLEVKLTYPTYRTGIPASIAGELRLHGPAKSGAGH